MPKYRVERDCFDSAARLWRAGEVVEVPEGVKVPKHFKGLDKPKVEPAVETPAKEVAPEITPEPPAEVKADEAPEEAFEIKGRKGHNKK